MRFKTTFRQAIFMLSFLSIFSLGTVSLWADNTPRLNNGKKWRIGYYEGGAYSDYTDTMRTLVKGLSELGWIKDQNPPDLFQEMPKPYWDWLSHCNSPFLFFE